MSLVKQGVPWHVAIDLSPVEQIAYLVALGELDGGKFDWRSMAWKDPGK